MNPEEIIETLKNIAYSMIEQNNHHTKYPIYAVQIRERVFGIEDAFCNDGVCYINFDDPELVFDDIDEVKDFLVSNKGEDYKFSDFDKTHYRDIYKNVQFFFSEKSAKEYIEANKHNGNYRIYVESAHDNQEMKSIIELLNSFI